MLPSPQRHAQAGWLCGFHAAGVTANGEAVIGRLPSSFLTHEVAVCVGNAGRRRRASCARGHAGEEACRCPDRARPHTCSAPGERAGFEGIRDQLIDPRPGWSPSVPSSLRHLSIARTIPGVPSCVIFASRPKRPARLARGLCRMAVLFDTIGSSARAALPFREPTGRSCRRWVHPDD